MRAFGAFALVMDSQPSRLSLCMDQRSGHTFKCARDIVVIGGLIATVNVLVSKADIGWMQLNPTPWMLLPLLIGARYTAMGGMVSGAIAAVVIAGANAKWVLEDAKDFVQDHPFFFSTLVLGGYVAGECGRFLRGQQVELRTTCDEQRATLERLEAELELTCETKQQLQQHLALHNATMAGLDDDLRKLVTAPRESLMSGLLTLLHQHTQLVSAALYRHKDGRLERVAVIHETVPLRPQLTLDETPLARRALEERSIVSVKTPTETGKDQPFLVALPYDANDEEGVLLVHDMPLRAFEWSNLARMELIMLWVFAMQLVRQQFGAPGTLVAPETWKVMLNQALATDQLHHVPSVVIRQSVEPALEKAVLKSLPATAVATRLPGSEFIAVLLPLAGEMEATSLVAEWQRLGLKGSAMKYPVSRGASAEDFWNHVSKP